MGCFNISRTADVIKIKFGVQVILLEQDFTHISFNSSILHSGGDNRRTIELVIKLHVDPFSKNMKPNVFKLCVIVTLQEYDRHMLLSVTFDIFLGHKVSIK